MNKELIIINKLESLKKSKFRSSFHLSFKDKEYIKKKGMDTIINHAYDFINNRLKPKYIKNDGKQIPMKGHPVFIAQHATGTCCRSCLFKWHNISKDKELSNNEVNYIVSIIIAWINKEMKFNNLK